MAQALEQTWEMIDVSPDTEGASDTAYSFFSQAIIAALPRYHFRNSWHSRRVSIHTIGINKSYSSVRASALRGLIKDVVRAILTDGSIRWIGEHEMAFKKQKTHPLLSGNHKNFAIPSTFKLSGLTEGATLKAGLETLKASIASGRCSSSRPSASKRSFRCHL